MIARRVSPEILTPILRYLLFLVVVPFVVVLSTEHVEGRKSAMRPPEILRFESRAGFQLDQARIDRLMRPWLSNRLTDLAAHKAYVDISIEARPERSGPGWGGSDDPLWHYYTDLSDTSVASIRDVALWALAYCELQRDSLRRALTLLDRMQNRQLAGTGVTRGIAHYGLGQYAEGDSVLHAEITSGQDVEAATIALANILLAKRDWDALDKLRTDPHARRFVPGRVLRALDYHSAATIPYFIGLLRSQAEPVMPVLILLALYTTGVWFFLIRWWDAFEKEPWSASLIAVALGAISPIGICAFRDATNQIGGWTTTRGLPPGFFFFLFWGGRVGGWGGSAPAVLLGCVGAPRVNEGCHLL